LKLRRASRDDLEAIRSIYNEGIEDRCATLETNAKDASEMAHWWIEHEDPYAVVVAETTEVIGWASLNRFSHRCAHAAIADLSVYIRRTARGQGVGSKLLDVIDGVARSGHFRKIVLHALDANEPGKRLYLKSGFTPVGVFRQHGEVDGRLVDVIAMEKLLS
jgi:phosphinothricin acetyltransferase